MCETGAALDANCESCVGQICQADSYCCNNAWDSICVYEVLSICNTSCPAAPNVPSCNNLYGNAASYSLCAESGNICEFAFNSTQGSCGSVCAAGGGQCISTVNDVNNQTCAMPNNPQLNPNTCNTTSYSSAICICTRGCGNGPPCQNGQTCQSGNCQ